MEPAFIEKVSIKDKNEAYTSVFIFITQQKVSRC